MGNAASAPTSNNGVPTLDELGGWNRPAVKRADELNAKVDWLGKRLLDQAQKIEHALDRRAGSNKAAAMAAVGGPDMQKERNKKHNHAFGGNFVSRSECSGRFDASSRPSSSNGNSPHRGQQNPSSSAPSSSPPSFTARPSGLRDGGGSRPMTARSMDFQALRSGGGSAPLQPSDHSFTRSSPLSQSADFSRLGMQSGNSSRPGFSSSPARPGTSVGSSRMGGGSASSPNHAFTSRPGTAAVSSRPGFNNSATVSGPGQRSGTRPGTAANDARNGSNNPYSKVRKFNTARGDDKFSGAAYKKLKQQPEVMEVHWRTRVAQAKRRLYLYLKGYMAWMSVLKRKRKGYAEHFTVELLPMFLTTALGPLTMEFGEHLKNCGGLVELGSQARARLTALKGGRMWLARARAAIAARTPGASVAAAGNQRRRSSSTGAGPEAVAPVGGSSLLENRSSISEGGYSLHAAANRGLQPSPPTMRSRQGMRTPVHGNYMHSNSPSHHSNATGNHGDSLGSHASGHDKGTLGRGLGNNPLSVKAASLDSSKADLRGVLMNGRKSINGGKVGDRIFAAKYAVEVDVVRRLTMAYLSKGSPIIRNIGTKEKGELDAMVKGEQLNLQLIANKANAGWVQRHKNWGSPVVFDQNMLQMGGVDTEMYKKVVPQLLAGGRIAIQLIYMGEDQATGPDKEGADAQEPAIMVDMWAVISKVFPHKVPSGQRISGLTALDRRVLQVLLDVERLAGKEALQQLVLLLSMDSHHTSWVAEQVVTRRHWTLQPNQILLTSVARMPGMMWEDVTKTFMVTYNSIYPYQSAGTGYAVLSLAWPSTAFHVSTAGEREYLSGSALQHLRQCQVEYMCTSLMCDWESLTPTTPAVDPNFVGAAIYCIDMKGAGMAVQVVQGKGDTLVRQQNSLVMAPEANSSFIYNIPFTDLQTPAARPLLINATKQGQVTSATNRYVFKLAHLAETMTGPNCFHLNVDVKAPCAHVSLDMADLTSNNRAKCVAVLGRTKGPDPRLQIFTKEWLRDFGSHLLQQDSNPGFRQLVTQIASTAQPVATIVSESSNPGTDRSIKMLLFVKNNEPSRHAFRLARALLRFPGDTLTLVHIANARAPVDTAKAVVESFSDVLVEHQLRRRVVAQMDKLADTMVEEVETLRPDLVILGTEQLSQLSQQPGGAGSGGGGSGCPNSPLGPQMIKYGNTALPLGGSLSSTSAALAMAKQVTDTPLLIVKSNSHGDLFHTPEVPGMHPPLNVMLEIQTSSLALLHWLAPRMTADKDKLFLARPYGLEKDRKESVQTVRMMNSFANAAAAYRFTAQKRPMLEGPAEGFPALVAQEHIDLLAIMAPNAKVTPHHILEVLRCTRTNLLIWRQGRVAEGLGQ